MIDAGKDDSKKHKLIVLDKLPYIYYYISFENNINNIKIKVLFNFERKINKITLIYVAK